MAESISSMVAWKLRKAIAGTAQNDAPRSGTATVQRRDSNGTVWVRLPGASMDTPVVGSVVASVAAGDTISYEIQGGRVNVTGNASDPAAGTSTVRAVRKATESAAKVASGAQAIADAIGQHFFTDDNGVHVSSEKDNPTGERNILMNSLGILLRQGSSWLASFSDSAVAFYDGLGNAASNVVAQFGIDGAVIGRSGESHMELDYHSLRMVDKGGNEYFEVQDLRDESGTVRVSSVRTGNGSTKEFRFDYTVEIDSVAVFVNGTEVTSGWTATNPTGPLFTETLVTFTTAPASGSEITLTGDVTDPTVTAKMKSYTLGIRSGGTGGEYSLATGYLTSASGPRSQAHGIGTRAAHADETVIGRYDAGAGSLSKRFSDALNGMALIIGNGNSSSRSNALEVAWDGTTYHKGDIPWTTFPVSSAASHYSSTKPLRYRKWGQMVNLMGAVTPNADVPAGQEYSLNIGTLPVGCRPQGEVTQLCQGSGTASWMLRITTGGVVTAERYRTGSGYAVMPAPSGGSGGAWLTMNCTFIV